MSIPAPILQLFNNHFPIMQQEFQLHFPIVNRLAKVRKSPYSLVILREGLYSVSVDKLPLVEYYIFFDSPVKGEQMKLKFYKTVSDGKWYDKSYSEEAELNSPEFGIPEMNKELKAVLDTHDAQTGTEQKFHRIN